MTLAKDFFLRSGRGGVLPETLKELASLCDVVVQPTGMTMAKDSFRLDATGFQLRTLNGSAGIALHMALL